TFFRDPHPTFHRMRAESPVYFSESMKIWMLTRYDQIDAMMRDPRFSSRRTPQLLGPLVSGSEGEEMLAQWSKLVFFLDPPEHPRIKAFLSKPFTPTTMEGLRPAVARIVRRTVDAVRDRGEMDVSMDLADPIALDVLMAMFNLPGSDRGSFRKWTTDILKPAGLGAPTEGGMGLVRQSSKALFDYVLSITRERKERRGEDMISQLLDNAESNPEMLEEVGQQCGNTIAAGYLTSTNQLTNTVLAFLHHPAELRRLRENPERIKGAIEEVVRFDPAVMSISRLALEDVEIGGRKIEKGQLAFGMTAAANRDPAVFSDPDKLDITRKTIRHLGFGGGGHYCLGAALIRMELEELLRALVELPNWRFGDEPCEYSSFHLQDRGPKTLPMRWDTP
ncbi:MAG: cytochrome P450, partial [Byssovorax sp.]